MFNNKMDKIIFKIVGGGLILLGAIDIILSWVMQIDITGVWWSALVFMVIGGFIWGMGDKN